MILYKYASIGATRQIISTGRIGFSRAGFFNDPFDKPYVPSPLTPDPISGIFEDTHATTKSYVWEERTGILSLTRSYSNALMWAHYAEGHTGAVLEINVEKAGFTDIETNLIPAQFGTVVYSRHRLNWPFVSDFDEGIAVGETHRFVLSHYEKWQRLFLTKPLDWAYEEEVRVAKCLGGLEPHGNSTNESGNCTIKNLGNRPLHCFEFPREAITRLFVGARASATEVAALEEECGELTIVRAALDDERFEMRFQGIE
ncbi:MAG: DUF2971 domain-containing protein [Gammaproteobacteria bacterium]|nr:DUF2971 domain-containing protein [Gammaproteobacteria bacterium]